MDEGQVATFTGEDVRFEIQRPGLGEGLGLVWGEEMVEACGDRSTLGGKSEVGSGEPEGSTKGIKSSNFLLCQGLGQAIS